jgi:hypothetical protein
MSGFSTHDPKVFRSILCGFDSCGARARGSAGQSPLLGGSGDFSASKRRSDRRSQVTSNKDADGPLVVRLQRQTRRSLSECWEQPSGRVPRAACSRSFQATMRVLLSASGRAGPRTLERARQRPLAAAVRRRPASSRARGGCTSSRTSALRRGPVAKRQTYRRSQSRTRAVVACSLRALDIKAQKVGMGSASRPKVRACANSGDQARASHEDEPDRGVQGIVRVRASPSSAIGASRDD